MQSSFYFILFFTLFYGKYIKNVCLCGVLLLFFVFQKFDFFYYFNKQARGKRNVKMGVHKYVDFKGKKHIVDHNAK